jgi:hypothetical protein
MQQFAETVIAVVNGKPAAPERAQVRAPEDLRD